METVDLANSLSQFIPHKNISSTSDILKVWGKDWTQHYEANPCLVLFPENTAQVAAILRFCNESRTSIIPSGGRTGLAAAAVATNGEIILSLDKMNKIIQVDPIGATIEVEAGAITQSVQDAAKAVDLIFAVDLAAKGSSQIGGNIATNAGGLKFIRYGGMREQVLGLEVVLADGKILDLNTRLRKNNSGYDLKQLFIGSEGTLGVITKATLRLCAIPKELELALLSVDSIENVLALLRLAQQKGLHLSAFEFFSHLAQEKVSQCFTQLDRPFAKTYPFYCLLECEAYHAGSMQNLLEEALANEIIHDGMLADSSASFAKIWSYRENITESLAQTCRVYKNDISLPIDQIANFYHDLEKITEGESIKLVVFGHIGDGNLHLNYTQAKTANAEDFLKRCLELEEKIFTRIAHYRGSISAEHGIGLVKKQKLHYNRSPLEIRMMQEIKKWLDPNSIMNPGKIFEPL